MSGKKEKKMRKALREEARLILAHDPRSGLSFSVGNVRQEAAPQAPTEPALSPEEKELARLFKTFATNAWRMRRILIDTESGVVKTQLPERSIAKLARCVDSLNGALEDVKVQIKGDYENTPYDEGDAVKVITFEDRKDLKRDEYIETLTPTVRWTDKTGKTHFLQLAEVVVGRAVEQ